MRRFIIVLAALMLLAAGAATPAAAHRNFAAGATCQNSTATGYDHVLVVMLENHAFSESRGKMPYLDSLADECAYMTHEKAITHPSLPNYLAITGGSTFGVTDDGSPTKHPIAQQSVFGQASDWKLYAQSMPGTCRLTNSFPYIVHHNPAAYYTPIRTACQQRNVNANELLPDASVEGFPAYAMLVPDNCHNGHNATNCGGGTTLGRADTYLSQTLDAFLASPTYQAGHTLVIVTFDEGSGSNQTVYTVFASEQIPTGTVLTAAATHYSVLALAERELGFACLKSSCTAAKITGPGL